MKYFLTTLLFLPPFTLFSEVLYKFEQYRSSSVQFYNGGGYQTLENGKIGVVFCPFPPTLVEKLSNL